jgi:hypothetical protein
VPSHELRRLSTAAPSVAAPSAARARPAKPLDVPTRTETVASNGRWSGALPDVSREPFPLVLQRRAPVAIRAHVRRAVVRLSVLVAADISVLLLLRFLFRGVSDRGWLGAPIAAIARALAPPGEFPYAQFVIAVMVGLLIFGNYRPGDHRRAPAKLFSAAALGLGLVFWGRLWEHNPWLSLLGFAAALVVLGLALWVERMIVDRVVRRVRPVGDAAVRTLVVGTGPVAQEAAESPALSDPAEFRVVGHWDVARVLDSDRRDRLSELVATIEAKHVEGIVLAGAFDSDLFFELVNLADAAGCHVYSLPSEFVRGDIEPRLVWRRGAPLMQLTRPGARGPQLAVNGASTSSSPRSPWSPYHRSWRSSPSRCASRRRVRFSSSRSVSARGAGVFASTSSARWCATRRRGAVRSHRKACTATCVCSK